MPLHSLLCCSYTRVSTPGSPTRTLTAEHTSISKKRADADPDTSTPSLSGDEAKKLGYKLQAYFTETLLPGQLPETPRGVAVGRGASVHDAGAPLLEDTLYNRGHGQDTTVGCGALPQPIAEHQQAASRAGSSAKPCAAVAVLPSLHVPSHLQASSATFDDDFRVEEAVTSPTGPSRDDRLAAEAAASQPPSVPHHAAATSQHGDGDLLATSTLLLEPALRQATSRGSGRRALYRLHRLPQLQEGQCAPASAKDAAVQAATLRDGCEEVLAWASTKGSCDAPVRRALALLALQRLQRELVLAREMPRCPVLLLPHRVYMQPHAVHVVYDGCGMELLPYLLKRQRLPEALCRSIMRQLLQALAALHADRWVHRNLSAETVWVEEEGQEPERPPPAPSEGEPLAPGPGTTPPLQSAPAIADTAAASAGPGLGTAATSAAAATAAAASHAPAGERDAAQPERSAHSTRGPQGNAALQRRDPVPGPRLRVRLGGLDCAVRLKTEVVSGCGSGGGSDGGGGGGGESREVPLRELLGCAYHLAPEAISGAGYGRPADVWAAGVLLFMLLTGRPPFPGANELEVMTRVLLAASESGYVAAKSGRAEPGSEPRPASSGSGSGDAAESRQGDGPGEEHARNSRDRREAAPSTRQSRSSAVVGAAAFGGFGYGGRSAAGHEAAESGGGASPGASPRAAGQPSALEQMVVYAVLETEASAECREALAGMLAADPLRRLSAEELLRLPWFVAGD